MRTQLDVLGGYLQNIPDTKTECVILAGHALGEHVEDDGCITLAAQAVHALAVNSLLILKHFAHEWPESKVLDDVFEVAQGKNPEHPINPWWERGTGLAHLSPAHENYLARCLTMAEGEEW